MQIDKWVAVAALLLAVGAEAQQASALSYNRVEAAVTRADAEDFEEDVAGFALAGSFEIGGTFHLWASYDSGSVEQSYTLEIYPPIHHEVEIDVRAFAIGVGVHQALSDRASVYGRIGAVQWRGELDTTGFGTAYDLTGISTDDQTGFGTEYHSPDFSTDYDSTGYTVAGGLRFQATPRVELRFGAAMFDDEDGESTTAGTAAVDIAVVDNVGIWLGGSVDEEGTGWGLGATLRF